MELDLTITGDRQSFNRHALDMMAFFALAGRPRGAEITLPTSPSQGNCARAEAAAYILCWITKCAQKSSADAPLVPLTQHLDPLVDIWPTRLDFEESFGDLSNWDHRIRAVPRAAQAPALRDLLAAAFLAAKRSPTHQEALGRALGYIYLYVLRRLGLSKRGSSESCAEYLAQADRHAVAHHDFTLLAGLAIQTIFWVAYGPGVGSDFVSSWKRKVRAYANRLMPSAASTAGPQSHGVPLPQASVSASGALVPVPFVHGGLLLPEGLEYPQTGDETAVFRTIADEERVERARPSGPEDRLERVRPLPMDALEAGAGVFVDLEPPSYVETGRPSTSLRPVSTGLPISALRPGAVAPASPAPLPPLPVAAAPPVGPFVAHLGGPAPAGPLGPGHGAPPPAPPIFPPGGPGPAGPVGPPAGPALGPVLHPAGPKLWEWIYQVKVDVPHVLAIVGDDLPLLSEKDQRKLRQLKSLFLEIEDANHIFREVRSHKSFTAFQNHGVAHLIREFLVIMGMRRLLSQDKAPAYHADLITYGSHRRVLALNPSDTSVRMPAVAGGLPRPSRDFTPAHMSINYMPRYPNGLREDRDSFIRNPFGYIVGPEMGQPAGLARYILDGFQGITGTIYAPPLAPGLRLADAIVMQDAYDLTPDQLFDMIEETRMRTGFIVNRFYPDQDAQGRVIKAGQDIFEEGVWRRHKGLIQSIPNFGACAYPAHPDQAWLLQTAYNHGARGTVAFKHTFVAPFVLIEFQWIAMRSPVLPRPVMYDLSLCLVEDVPHDSAVTMAINKAAYRSARAINRFFPTIGPSLRRLIELKEACKAPLVTGNWTLPVSSQLKPRSPNQLDSVSVRIEDRLNRLDLLFQTWPQLRPRAVNGMLKYGEQDRGRLVQQVYESRMRSVELDERLHYARAAPYAARKSPSGPLSDFHPTLYVGVGVALAALGVRRYYKGRSVPAALPPMPPLLRLAASSGASGTLSLNPSPWGFGDRVGGLLINFLKACSTFGLHARIDSFRSELTLNGFVTAGRLVAAINCVKGETSNPVPVYWGALVAAPLIEEAITTALVCVPLLGPLAATAARAVQIAVEFTQDLWLLPDPETVRSWSMEGAITPEETTILEQTADMYSEAALPFCLLWRANGTLFHTAMLIQAVRGTTTYWQRVRAHVYTNLIVLATPPMLRAIFGAPQGDFELLVMGLTPTVLNFAFASYQMRLALAPRA